MVNTPGIDLKRLDDMEGEAEEEVPSRWRRQDIQGPRDAVIVDSLHLSFRDSESCWAVRLRPLSNTVQGRWRHDDVEHQQRQRLRMIKQPIAAHREAVSDDPPEEHLVEEVAENRKRSQQMNP